MVQGWESLTFHVSAESWRPVRPTIPHDAEDSGSAARGIFFPRDSSEKNRLKSIVCLPTPLSNEPIAIARREEVAWIG